MDKALHDVCTAVVDAYAHQRVAQEDRAAHEQVSCPVMRRTGALLSSVSQTESSQHLTALGIYLYGTLQQRLRTPLRK